MILIGTDDGLYLRRPEAEGFARLGSVEGPAVSVALTGTGHFYAVTGDGRVLSGEIDSEAVQVLDAGLNHVARCVYIHGGDDVYVGTEPPALYRLDKGNRSWDLLAALHDLDIARGWSAPGGAPAVRSMAAHPNEKSCLYVNIHVGGVIRTEDGGLSWTPSAPGLEEDVHMVAVNPSDPEAVFCATADGFYRSGDEGDTWERRNDGLEHLYCRAIAPDPYNPEVLLISGSPSSPAGWAREGKRFAVFRSEDGGRRWTRVTEGLPAQISQEVDTDCLEFSALRPDWVFCGTRGGRLYESYDGGRTWCIAADRLPPIRSLAVI